MVELMAKFVDSQFLDSLGALSPAVGVGVLLGFIAAVIGWVFGLVIRLGKVDV